MGSVWRVSIPRSMQRWVLLVCASVQPCAAQATLANGAALAIPYGRIVGAFFFCALLAVGAVLLLRRKNIFQWPRPLQSKRRIRIVEVTRLNVKSTLYLIEWDQRELLVCSDPTGTRLLLDRGVVPPLAAQATVDRAP